MQREVIVSGYTRHDGTYVPTHTRPAPTESSSNASDNSPNNSPNNSPKSGEYAADYTRTNSTIVKGYYRSS